MNENGHQQQKQNGRELVEAIFRQARQHERAIQEPDQTLVEEEQGDASKQARVPSPPGNEPPTIPYTQLPAAQPDSPLYQEWNVYRREVTRLLAEGQEGRFLLIKGEDIIGIWDTPEQAKAVALQKYLMQPCLIQQIRRREPVVRMSARFWGCQS